MSRAIDGGLVRIRDQAHGAGHGRDARLGRDLLRRDLVAHRLDRRHGRADEGDTFGLQRPGEGRVFRKKAVARMHRLGAGLADRRHDPVDHDIALGGGRRADAHRLVGQAHMHGVGIGIGMDGDRPDPHLLRRFDHPARDLAAIRNQDFFEHRLLPVSGPGPLPLPTTQCRVPCLVGRGSGPVPPWNL